MLKKCSNFGETNINIATNKRIPSNEQEKKGYEINRQNSIPEKNLSLDKVKCVNNTPPMERSIMFITPINRAKSKENVILCFVTIYEFQIILMIKQNENYLQFSKISSNFSMVIFS